ncbi:apolipoprotein L domain-containing protein 1-like isoform X2 [Hoplias malabaricus]|uniref:apolipoprotein L domain-containing protein 1-like isoform X2 n=1 Tax=Hoplias malabaricus TaxID=27720 RepID=UPI003462B2EB
MALKQQVFTPKVKKPMVNMTDHLTRLIQIRQDPYKCLRIMDEPFRLTFLFNHRAQDFIDSYSECQSRMFQYLSDLEGTAVQLERMFLGSSISSLAGSSVGFIGGALSIAGLVLAPFTAVVSLWLTAGGAVLGLTSVVNSFATLFAETRVNSRESNKANDIFKDFMADVQKVLDCIELVACSKRDVPHLDEVKVSGVEIYNQLLYSGKDVFKAIKEIISVRRALKTIKIEKAAVAEAHVALGDVTEVRIIPKTS